MISQAVVYSLQYCCNCVFIVLMCDVRYFFCSQEAVTALPLNLFVTQALHSKSTLYLDFTHHLFLLLTSKYVTVQRIRMQNMYLHL